MQDADDYSDDVEDNLLSSYTFDYGEDSVFVAASWPTPNNITEEQARQACQGDMEQSAALTMCGNLIDTAPIQESCVTDVQVRYKYGCITRMIFYYHTQCKYLYVVEYTIL